MNNTKKTKRVLVLFMSALFLAGISIAFIYYGYQNKYQDYRVLEARELYNTYNDFAQQNDFANVFVLLDSIELIYRRVPHYINSYEQGVLYNNRAAAYLTMALHYNDSSLSLDGVNLLSQVKLIGDAKQNVNRSIMIYENWLNKYANYSDEQFTAELKHDFIAGIVANRIRDTEKFWRIRLTELKNAQLDTKRRLSVAYTNLGIIERWEGNYEMAIEYYQKALKLWNRNLTAENNINMLLGKPLKKQNFIHKILPPDKSN